MKAKAQLEERVDLNKIYRNEEIYVISVYRKNFWTNKWMQEPRKIFCRLQVHHYDPSVQYRKGWRLFKRKRVLTLCYNCRRSRHLAKEFAGIGPICLCCKAIGHEVEDFPRMISKIEKMNMRQENYKEGQETKDILNNNT